MNDILSGQVDLFFEVISTAAPQVQSKRAFALFATGNARSSLLPDVPTTSRAWLSGPEPNIVDRALQHPRELPLRSSSF